ncbi:MAG: GNAT family N-acetyltransferase [Methanobacteriota archaeon]|nr:MAG: GNAT family N-acetyltransferase [Euryarchaeota archaeon]
MKDDEYAIHKLPPGRLDDLVEAQREIFSDYMVPITVSREFMDSFMRSVGGKTENIVVATDDGGIVGFVNPVVDGKEAWIGGLGVAARARRRGIGKRLMAAAEDIARDGGAEVVLLEVIEGNLQAMSLYASLGYSKTASYVSAEGLPQQFAGYGPEPMKATVDEVRSIHSEAYSEACWQRRKASALVESGGNSEVYRVDRGFVALRRVGATGFIPFIGVAPGERRKGIGTSLAKFALNRLWELGAFKVALYNVNDDLVTSRMLDKFDFKVTLRQVEMRKAI